MRAVRWPLFAHEVGHLTARTEPVSGGQLVQRVRVEDRVAVALLGEEALAVLREVLVDGVAGDERVEVRGAGRDSFGRSRRPRRCASSCREPNDPETWMATVASGRSIEKFATFDTTSTVDRARRGTPGRAARARRSGVAPVSFGASERLGELVDLVEVLADHEDALARVLARRARLHDAELRGRGRREPVALVVGGGRVLEPLAAAGRSMRTS